MNKKLDIDFVLYIAIIRQSSAAYATACIRRESVPRRPIVGIVAYSYPFRYIL